MSSFKDRMYPEGTVKVPLVIEDETYEVELRPPLWGEYVMAESRAMTELKDRVVPKTDAQGVPQPPSETDKRLLSVQTGIELAKVCVIKVGDVSTKELGFWDRQRPMVMLAIASLMLEQVWDSGVGRKNSKPPAERPVTSGPD
jgi:hypothetical protein